MKIKNSATKICQIAQRQEAKVRQKECETQGKYSESTRKEDEK